jgi:hypothetical protein
MRDTSDVILRDRKGACLLIDVSIPSDNVLKKILRQKELFIQECESDEAGSLSSPFQNHLDDIRDKEK